eukprot:CAMPEP_0113537166 /NCGR_PEP_ID=MMETSP0015_2-20120614/6679_1 /TAXON_ID=2838 /ORGANISM="Odontella" /LENGTH=46 /DNA_ID=CAMNT_0000436639 /DNA_START=118 /DNA_END=255 /DNA_ORIENTATION=- /assembly_acc=CAM_ASM_000160
MSDVEQAQDTAFPQDSDPTTNVESQDEYGFFSWPGGKYGVNFGTHD